jgi:hypothetical protein
MCIRIHQDLCDISCVAFIKHSHRHWNKQGPSLTIYGVIFHALSDSMFSTGPACSFRDRQGWNLHLDRRGRLGDTLFWIDEAEHLFCSRLRISSNET